MRKLACIMAVFATTLSVAHGQDFPDRPIKIVVPGLPATMPDLVARIIGQKLSEHFAQTVVIENRPGAAGSIGALQVARGPADGYTLLLPQDSLITVNPHIFPDMGWSPVKDLVPVASIASNQFYLAITPSLPVKTFQQFIEHARRTKPPLFYGSGGPGNQGHLAIEMLKQQAGIDLVHVPYRGATQAASGAMAGDVHVIFSGGSIAPLLESNKLRALAVTGKTRLKQFPNLPTVTEFYPNLDISIWLALFAPAGIPEPVLAQLRGAMSRILALPDTNEKLRALSAATTPYLTTPGEFAAVIQRNLKNYGEVVKSLGLKLK